METYKIVPLRDNLWAIDEIGKTVMYVVNGTEKALLLDTGFGFVPLREVVRSLCGDKPVVVVNSHGHGDHNSGNNQFDVVHVGRFDEPASHAVITPETRAHFQQMFFEQFAAQGMRIDKLMMTGGAARSDLWSEIVGYVTGCEIYRPREPETCCLGAAMIAFVGLGVYDDFNACRSAMVKSSRLELSDQSMYDFYREKGRHYRALIQKLL